MPVTKKSEAQKPNSAVDSGASLLQIAFFSLIALQIAWLLCVALQLSSSVGKMLFYFLMIFPGLVVYLSDTWKTAIQKSAVLTVVVPAICMVLITALGLSFAPANPDEVREVASAGSKVGAIMLSCR